MRDTNNNDPLASNAWGKCQEKSSPNDRETNRQRLRLQRATLAFASYLLIGVYTLYLFFSGQIQPDPGVLIGVNTGIVASYYGYFWLIRTGHNRRFKDPSLTWAHLTLASTFTVFLFGLARTLFAQDLYFFAFMMTLLFSAFGLNLRQILATAIPCFVALTILLLLHHPMISQSLKASIERGGIYFVSMGWMITFAAIISRLRQVLSNKNRELQATMTQLNEIAIRDDLTGTYNRRYLFQALKNEIARSDRTGHPLCIGLLDIDHFKPINDTYGHQVGDQILRDLIPRIRHSIRKIDDLTRIGDTPVLSRFGGEEFLIALPLTSSVGAYHCAERIIEMIRSQPFATPAGPIRITASLGIAEYQGVQDTMEALVGRADQALFEAKKQGRDQVALAPCHHSLTLNEA